MQKLLYSSIFQIRQILTQTNIFLGNNNPFLIKPTVTSVKISQKKFLKDIVTVPITINSANHW